MAMTIEAINLIGRLRPQIFDILGNPYGPHGHVAHFGHVAARRADAAAELNPQPLPPVDGPQPEPWRESVHLGMITGSQLVNLAFTASQLGLSFEVDIDEWCGTHPRIPIPVPPWWPGPFPGPWPDPRESLKDFDQLYLAGLALSLELSSHLWSGYESAGSLEKVHGAAIDLANADLVGTIGRG